MSSDFMPRMSMSERAHVAELPAGVDGHVLR